MKKLFFFIIFGLTLLLKNKTVLGQINFNITVYPAISEQTVIPGDSTHLLLQFRNNSKELIHGTIKVADYIVTDKKGVPMLIENTNQVLKYGASKWIIPSYSIVSIPGNDFVAVTLNINVPNDVINCGNYALVYFEPDTISVSNKDTTIKSESTITAKIGALVNFKVKNINCREDLRVMDFNLPAFLEYGPIKLNFDLFNFGNVHVAPKGNLVLTNMLNIFTDREPIKEQKIFPETAKSYESSVGSKWMFGRYKIILNANYGEKNTPLITKAYVWVFPWRIGLIILLTLVIIILIIRGHFIDSIEKRQLLEKELIAEKSEIEKLKETARKKRE